MKRHAKGKQYEVVVRPHPLLGDSPTDYPNGVDVFFVPTNGDTEESWQEWYAELSDRCECYY